MIKAMLIGIIFAIVLVAFPTVTHNTPKPKTDCERMRSMTKKEIRQEFSPGQFFRCAKDL